VQLNVKWPNDILINEKKIAGILCQVVDNGVIVGVGLNVSMHQEELPVASATSLLLENYSELDRSEILKRILQNFEKNFQIWLKQGSAPFISSYQELCSSLNQEIQIISPTGESKAAIATGISALGELILSDGVLVNSGDVLHLR
jgi:BirA family biotin operon repressor/biotin-[acetyl-CoA-carboxylase] ligase